MHIAPHENLTITLLRRNNFSDLRLRGAAPRMAQLHASNRLRFTGSLHRTPASADRFPWNSSFPFDGRGGRLDVLA